MTEAGISIAEAAAASGLSTHTLRYYERAGLTLNQISRNTAGRRVFHEEDLLWIAMLTRLRATGMPIRDVRRYTELCRAGAGTEAQRLDLLHRHREHVQANLAQMTVHLAAIDAKIDIYSTHLNQVA
ncbi:MAG: MerR family transcriptional regulator [Angustibacter sp.]